MTADPLLTLIEGALNKHVEKALTTATAETLTGIQYELDRPDIDVTRNGNLGGISLILRNGSQAAETQVRNLLSSQQFADKIIDVRGSNSIKEDIEESFKQLIKSSTKKVKLPKHTKKPPVVRKTKPDKGGIRDLRGRFFSPTSLILILNLRLHDQIKQNMGKGSARSILNYRSGRFARSAIVKSVLISKEALVTAFYTYMKYPYQTFEPGFRQGTPASRNPQVLIGKSIRQIAVETITNRLRAVPL